MSLIIPTTRLSYKLGVCVDLFGISALDYCRSPFRGTKHLARVDAHIELRDQVRLCAAVSSSIWKTYLMRAK